MTLISHRTCFWLGVAMIATLPAAARAQSTGSVTGRVLDGRTNQPIAGVQVSVDDRNNTLTDKDGRYVMPNIPAGARTISARMIGYGTTSQAVTVTAGQTAAVDLTLNVRPVDLDAIVVTGQGGEISRRRIATTIDVISRETIEATPVTRLDELLQTKLPGAQIRMTSGQAGTTSLIRTRGINSVNANSTPVIYVDGVRVDNLNTIATLGLGISGPRHQGAATSAIADLPLENIERVEHIPGGAATTLYGSDAANGVIQIFTRRGVPGETRAFVESRVGYETPITQFHFFDRTKDLLYRNGLSQQYSGGIEGGNSAFTFSVSGNVRASESHRVYGDNRAMGFRSGLGAELGPKGRYTASFSYNESDVPRFRNGNSGGYQSLWFVEGGRSNAFGFSPDIDDMDDTTFDRLKQFVDKAERLQNYSVFVRRFQTSHGFNFEPLPSLAVRATFGVDNRFSKERAVTTNEFLIHTRSAPAGSTDRGSIQNYDRKFTGFTVDLGAQHTLNRERLSVISSFGGQIFRNDDEQIAYSATNVRDGSETLEGAGVTSSTDRTYRVANWGIFGQSNIGWLDRYFIELGLRADQNTAFGESVGRQLYPKVGLSYALSSEPWLRDRFDEATLTDLRLRAAYGVAGNFPTPFANDRTINFNPFNGFQAATFGQPGNTELKPERTSTYEAGADLSLLSNRILFGMSWYNARTEDALMNVPPAPSIGESSQLANVGEIENKGFEFRTTVVPITRSSVRLTLTASLNTLKNKVLSTRGAPAFALSGLSVSTVQGVVQEGFPVGYIRGPDAVYDASGRITEVKQFSYLGKPTPDKFGSVSASLNLGSRLTFNVDGDYQVGAQAHSFDKHFRFLYGVKGSEKYVPQAVLEQFNNNRTAIWLQVFDRFVENTDYFMVRNVSADYRVPPTLLRAGIRDMRIGFSITNPWSWAASSFDPEVDLSGAMEQGGATVGGFNYSTDSHARAFMLNLRFGF